MNIHRAEHLNHHDVRIDLLTIHSFEMGIYLAEADYDGRKAFLVNAQNQPQQFHSVEEVRQALSASVIKEAYLVHQSAYDEMCGGPEKVDNTLRLKLFVQDVA